MGTESAEVDPASASASAGPDPGSDVTTLQDTEAPQAPAPSSTPESAAEPSPDPGAEPTVVTAVPAENQTAAVPATNGQPDGPTVFIDADPVLGPLPDPPDAPVPGESPDEVPLPLNPGGQLGRGRYRLLDAVGRDDRCGAVFWRGRDSVLERDVALTVFACESDDSARLAMIRSAMQRALRSARLESPGAARVLDVLEPEPGQGETVAAVVAEWTPGTGLVDLVAQRLPPPSVAASMLATLAGAVDDAHRHGLVLGCDHPQRIRITPDGHARLAFHAPPVDTGTRDDVRGLGAALYLLLTGYWALPDGFAGLPPAPHAENGLLVSPRTMRPEVSLELSTLALRSLAGDGSAGVHTGAAVARVLERNSVEPAFGRGLEQEDPEADSWLSPELDPEEPRRRRMKLGIAVGGLVAGCLVIFGWVGLTLANVFGDDDPSGPALVISTAPPGGPVAAPPPAPVGPPVQVSTLRVYDISGAGSPDNAAQVRRAIDGNPTTSWSTDAYKQPFPVFKPGLGLMLTFPQAVRPASVTIASPSPGTVLEIRAANAPNAPLAQTRLIGSATLRSGETVIPLQDGPPARYLLVWITTLAGSENQSALGEITIRQAQ